MSVLRLYAQSWYGASRLKEEEARGKEKRVTVCTFCWFCWSLIFVPVEWQLFNDCPSSDYWETAQGSDQQLPDGAKKACSGRLRKTGTLLHYWKLGQLTRKWRPTKPFCGFCLSSLVMYMYMWVTSCTCVVHVSAKAWMTMGGCLRSPHMVWFFDMEICLSHQMFSW